MLEAESEAEDKSSRPRPRPRTKFWPRGQLGLEDLTSLALPDLSSLDFVIMKMIRTNNIEIVRNCQSYLGFNLPSDLWQIALKGLMLNMPPQGAVLLIMVSRSLSLLMF